MTATVDTAIATDDYVSLGAALSITASGSYLLGCAPGVTSPSFAISSVAACYTR